MRSSTGTSSTRDAVMLAEVLNRWEVRPAREIEGHGTLLRMGGLRSQWTERMFRRLSLRLSRLLSPFRTDKDRFVIHIESDEFPEYSGELRQDFLEKAPYRVEAQFDGEQTVTIALNDRQAGRPALERPGRAFLRPGQDPHLRVRPRGGIAGPDRPPHGGQGVAARMDRGEHLPRRLPGLALRRAARRLAAAGPAAGEQPRREAEQQPGHRLHRHRPGQQPRPDGPDQPRRPDQQPGPRQPPPAREFRPPEHRGGAPVDPAPGQARRQAGR